MIVHVYSGITSRLHTVADAIEIMRDHCEEQLIVLWPVDAKCGIAVEDVLEMEKYKDINISFISFPGFVEKHFKILNAKQSVFKNMAKCIYNVYVSIYNSITNKEARIVKKYTRGRERFDFEPSKEVGWSGEGYRSHLCKTWNSIKERLKKDTNIYIHAYCGIIKEERACNLNLIFFKDTYWNRVHEILSGVEHDWLVGVHVRRTDHAASIKMSPLKAFMREMDKQININPKTVFFLATDDEEVQQQMVEKYGKTIVYQDKAWGRNTMSGMQGGILDCLCLSQCKLIIGSCTSVFSHFAAEYGEIEIIEAK